MSRVYQHNFTWSHPLGTHCLAHTDGAVSCLLEWDGINSDLLTAAEVQSQFDQLLSLLQQLPGRYQYEFHLWREYDSSLIDEYLAQGQRIERAHEFGLFVRKNHADHLRQFAMSNHVGVVVTWTPSSRLSLWPRAGASLKKQAQIALEMVDDISVLVCHLSAAVLVSNVIYQKRIYQCSHREAFEAGYSPNYDPRYLLNEQLLASKPVLANDRLWQGDQCIKTLYLFLYPDAFPAWASFLAQQPLPLHVSALLRPMDTQAAMRQSENQSKLSSGILTHRDEDRALKGLDDMKAFRIFVAEHNLRIFQNAYIINLYGSDEQNQHIERTLINWIDSHGGQVRSDAFLQYPYFRYSQPGQGYLCDLWRPDHAIQVANMLPVQVYGNGDARAESIRLGAARQVVKFDVSSQSVAHVFSAAMTRGGKGVDAATTVSELYPLGVDFYFVEVGGSYRWPVEAFGGTYTKIDPGESSINPFPAYSVASLHNSVQGDSENELPLKVEFASGTVNALAFLLTDGKTELTVHEDAAAQLALQFCYAVPDKQLQRPSFEHYLNALRDAKSYNEHPRQIRAAHDMAAKLDSFLSTQAGRLFLKDDNLTLSPGITGVDLKDVEKANPKLLQFYLVFLSLKLSFIAFSSRQRAFIVLDEVHKFLSSKPEIVGKLASEIVRMGAKENTFLWLISQGIEEVEAIERAVIDNMPNRNLLFRTGSHDLIADRIGMPEGARTVWKNFEYPVDKPYRPAIRSTGDEYHHLHLTFPQALLDLADTSPAALSFKEIIGRGTHDPVERLNKLAQAMAAHAHE